MAKNKHTPENEPTEKELAEQARQAEKENETQPSEATPEEETNDSALREASENATRVHKEAKQHENDQAAENANREIAAVVSRSVREADGKIFIITKTGEEEAEQELGDSQSEGFNRYKTMEWNNDGEKDAARAITLYSFGIGDKEAFEKEVSELSEEEAKAFYKIAKKLDLGVVTKKHFKKLQEEDED